MWTPDANCCLLACAWRERKWFKCQSRKGGFYWLCFGTSPKKYVIKAVRERTRRLSCCSTWQAVDVKTSAVWNIVAQSPQTGSHKANYPFFTQIHAATDPTSTVYDNNWHMLLPTRPIFAYIQFIDSLWCGKHLFAINPAVPLRHCWSWLSTATCMHC